MLERIMERFPVGVGNRTNISAIDYIYWLDRVQRQLIFWGDYFSWSQENGRKFVFCGTQAEKSETKLSDFSFYGLGNGSDLRHLLYLASSAHPSPAVGQDRPAGARYRRGSARPPLCPASKGPTVGMIPSQFGAQKDTEQKYKSNTFVFAPIFHKLK